MELVHRIEVIVVGSKSDTVGEKRRWRRLIWS